eukprot:TRINITY_DN1538_c1_g1_i1.p1 TRINITY_DN1538_c1_g1~~TRINITY_DN1538_c1_g1_i1.p1  ORF type:complete len:448 (-),score=146.59 TRINITY_DN1538_c1_g1_i1:264-1607(-)
MHMGTPKTTRIVVIALLCFAVLLCLVSSAAARDRFGRGGNGRETFSKSPTVQGSSDTRNEMQHHTGRVRNRGRAGIASPRKEEEEVDSVLRQFSRLNNGEARVHEGEERVASVVKENIEEELSKERYLYDNSPILVPAGGTPTASNLDSNPAASSDRRWGDDDESENDDADDNDDDDDDDGFDDDDGSGGGSDDGNSDSSSDSSTGDVDGSDVDDSSEHDSSESNEDDKNNSGDGGEVGSNSDGDSSSSSDTSSNNSSGTCTEGEKESVIAVDKSNDPYGHVVRAMPNIAVEIRESMTCVVGRDDTAIGQESTRRTEALFGQVGTSMVLRNEDLLVAATALCACGLSFFLRAIRAAAQGGVEIGFHAEDAITMAAQTALGASSLLLQKKTHPEHEVDMVTTPMGCTISGLNKLEHKGFSSAMIKGITTSARKAQELYEKRQAPKKTN